MDSNDLITNTFNEIKKSFVGFDDLMHQFMHHEEIINDFSGGKYPPHNIHKDCTSKDGSCKYIIEIAVAGFKEDEIRATLNPGYSIVVEGEKSDEKPSDNERNFQTLHRGISQMRFRKIIRISERLELGKVTLENGLLRIELSFAEKEYGEDKEIKIKVVK